MKRMLSASFISAMMIMIIFTALLRGLFPMVRRELGDFGFHMVRGVVGILLIIVLRSLYWDVTQVVSGEHWSVIREFLGGQNFSTLFNVLGLIPAYDFSKAKYSTIPDKDRPEWRWYTAWAYPGDKCFINWRSRRG